MSGPIVRTGTTPEFWKNWDRVLGEKPAGSKTAKTAKKKSATAGAKAKSSLPKKVAKKPAKKAATKKKK